MKCPIANTRTKLKVCNVTTCMYHSTERKTGCAQPVATSENIHFYKGLPKSKYIDNRKKAVTKITDAFILYKYLDWVETTNFKPWSTAYDKTVVIESVNKLMLQVEPYNIDLYKWNTQKIAASICNEGYKQFSKSTKSSINSGILHFEPHQVGFLIKLFKDNI